MSHVANMSKPSIIFPFFIFYPLILRNLALLYRQPLCSNLGKVLYLATPVKTEKGLGEETKMCWFHVSHSQVMTVALGDCKAFSPVTQVVISGAGSLNLGQQGSKNTYCFRYTTLFIISSKNRIKCNFGATRMSSRLFVNKQNRTWLLGLIMWLWRERPD